MQFTCVICYNSLRAKKYEDSDEIKIVATVCGHVFHNACIHGWLQENRSCPECRSYVKIGSLTKLYINFCSDDQSNSNDVESWNELNEQLWEKKLECVEKDKEIIELRTDCYLSKRKIYNQEELIVELETRFANSELQILEKDLKIDELRTYFALSERESLNKDKKIKELQTCFVDSELQILEKDAKIDELQTWFAHSKMANLVKDDKIKELQTCCARLELEISEKDGKIEELQTRFSHSELENSKKDEKIEELQTCCASFERDVKKMLQQEMKLNDEISAMKREAKKLSCVEDENQKLVLEKYALQNEKNILMSELEHLKTVKTIVEECSIDVRKKILVDVMGQVSSDDEKVAIHRIATYCSLLEQKLAHLKVENVDLRNKLIKVKQELTHSKEENTDLQNKLIKVQQELTRSKEEKADLQNKLIKVKQELTRSKEESTWVPNELKLVKYGLRESQLHSAKEARQLREEVRKFKDLNSSSFSSSCGMPRITNTIPSQCNNLDQCSLVCVLNRESSSDCKNQITLITEDFPENKRQKANLLDFMKKYSEDLTEHFGTPVLRLANDALPARRKIRCKSNEDSFPCVEYKNLGGNFRLVLVKKRRRLSVS